MSTPHVYTDYEITVLSIAAIVFVAFVVYALISNQPSLQNTTRYLTPIIIVCLFGIIAYLYISSQTKPPAKETILVDNRVDIGDGWMPFIDVKRGEIIEASGQIEGLAHGSDLNNRRQSGPDGLPIFRYEWDHLSSNNEKVDAMMWDIEKERFKLAKDLPYLALVGYVKSASGTYVSVPRLVGTRSVVLDTGKLYLAINDYVERRDNGNKASFGLKGNYRFHVLPPDDSFREAWISSREYWQSTPFVGGMSVEVIGTVNTKNNPRDPLFSTSDYKGWLVSLPDIVTLSWRPAPACPFMALVGRASGGPPFCVNQGTLPGSGPIEMIVNDIHSDRWGVGTPSWVSENEGGFTVRTRK
jgi:hypothetical protein